MLFTWKVTDTVYDSASGIITKAIWTCSSGDAAVTHGTDLPAPTGGTTPYSDVTEDEVLSWLWAVSYADTAAGQTIKINPVNRADIEARITSMLNSTATSGTPWKDPEELAVSPDLMPAGGVDGAFNKH